MDNNRDGFEFASGRLNRDMIIIEDQRLEEYIEYILKGKIRSIYIYSTYYKREDLDFLRKLPGITKINIRAPITKFDALYDQDNLTDLSISDVTGELDLTRLPSLEVLSLEGSNQRTVGLRQCCNLKKLNLSNYKPVSKDLSELSDIKQLEEFTITQSSVHSLQGLGNLKSLRKIELNYLSRLEDITDLEHIADSLSWLSIESCKRVDFSPLQELHQLERLSLVNCGALPSLAFIEKLQKLKFLVFLKTNIIDGDLSYCKNLDYVGFDNKKHYSHKMTDFS